MHSEDGFFTQLTSDYIHTVLQWQPDLWAQPRGLGAKNEFEIPVLMETADASNQKEWSRCGGVQLKIRAVRASLAVLTENFVYQPFQSGSFQSARTVKDKYS